MKLFLWYIVHFNFELIGQENDIQAEIEYIPEDLSTMVQESLEFAEFAQVFAKFSSMVEKASAEDHVIEAAKDDQMDIANSDEELESNPEDSAKKIASKKKLRKMSRLTVAELKQLVRKPDIVEVRFQSDIIHHDQWVDVTAADPKLLVTLKSYRNTVPVPVHWSQKRKYLQNKRGIEKPPFELPGIFLD